MNYADSYADCAPTASEERAYERHRASAVERARTSVLADDTELLCLLDDLACDNCRAVAGIIRLALEGDDIRACDRLRNILTPRIEELVERLADRELW